MSTTKSSKVRIRNLIGRIFSPSGDKDKDDEMKPSSSAMDISQPYNTVHRVHVGYDGQKFSGLPQPWMDILLRDISIADQKSNPNAVVTAVKFYAASMKEHEKTKFMTTNSVFTNSDDEVDVQLTGQVTEHLRKLRCSNGAAPSSSPSPSGSSSAIRPLANGTSGGQLSSSSTDASLSLSDRMVPSPAPVPTSESAPQLQTISDTAPPIHPRSAHPPPPPPPPQRNKASYGMQSTDPNMAPDPRAPPRIPPKVPPKPSLTMCVLMIMMMMMMMMGLRRIYCYRQSFFVCRIFTTNPTTGRDFWKIVNDLEAINQWGTSANVIRQ
ncbi:unnamed protein product [Caenorhabditis bovis]|uniref:CRIB domain-containing protein n=1 Tax=Caenorhabditis bovis TaxID=2654633 RepID=A0A8S1EZH1_9PELO|nr:unnamed protein product [Caenorhabditis bovis]